MEEDIHLPSTNSTPYSNKIPPCLDGRIRKGGLKRGTGRDCMHESVEGPESVEDVEDTTEIAHP